MSGSISGELLTQVKLEKFFSQLPVLESEGQAAVDVALWALLDDEVFRERFNDALPGYVSNDFVRMSVFTAPVLYEECVRTIFEGAVGKPYFGSREFSLLLERDDFSDGLFGVLVACMSRTNVVGTIMFLERLREKDKLTVGRLLAVNSEGYLFSLIQRWAVPALGEDRYSVQDYVWMQLKDYWKGMPDSWIEKMVETLQQSG